MKVRKFPNLERLVKNSGGEDAQNELRELLALASTNFAACPDAHAAVVAVSERMLVNNGGGRLISDICNWLFAKAEEMKACHAPTFITGCKHLVAGCDECLCDNDECPWIKHTGVFR